MILFLSMTLVLFHFFQWMDRWIKPTEKYREPHGASVKVSSLEENSLQETDPLERLKLFYWAGE